MGAEKFITNDPGSISAKFQDREIVKGRKTDLWVKLKEYCLGPHVDGQAGENAAVTGPNVEESAFANVFE
jgi:hypothetical protein